jgi:polyvinyl alcohol dehydrogenase (cytochrome)
MNLKRISVSGHFWRTLAICSLALVLVAGCDSSQAGTTTGSPTACVCEWPVYRGDGARDGHPGGLILTADQARRLKVAWSVHLDGPIDGSPIVAPTLQHGLVVVAATEAGEVEVVSENTGIVFWKHTGLGNISGSPVVAGGWLLAATLTGHMYAFDINDGRMLWDWTAPGAQPAIWSSPIVIMVAAYVVLVGVGSQSGDNPLEPGRVVALDVGSGRTLWTFCVEANCAPGGGVWSSVAVDGAGRGFVGTGNPDDGVIAFNAATGQRLWATSLYADQGRDLDVGATPIVLSLAGRERVAVGSNGGVFAELDASSGSVIWSKALVAGSAVHGLIASPAYDGASLYVPSASPPTGMFALDPQTGAMRWQHRTSLPVYSAPAVGDGVVIFGTGDVFGDAHQGGLLALSTSDGALLWSYDAHSSVFSAPAIVFTMLIVGDTSGDLLAFVPG